MSEPRGLTKRFKNLRAQLDKLKESGKSGESQESAQLESQLGKTQQKIADQKIADLEQQKGTVTDAEAKRQLEAEIAKLKAFPDQLLTTLPSAVPPALASVMHTPTPIIAMMPTPGTPSSPTPGGTGL